MSWKSTVPVLLSLAAFSRAGGITAYKDSQCTKKLEISSDGTVVPDSTLTITNSITDWNNAAGHWYDKMSYKDANTGGSNPGTGNNDVYWKIEDPGPGCSVLLMKDAEMSWQYLNPLPGNLVLAATNDGCYYSSLAQDQGLIVSFCCGLGEGGDCARADLGTHTLAKRDEPTKKEEKRVPGSNAARAIQTVKERKVVINNDPFVKRDAPECTAVGDGFQFRTSGPQRAVTNPERCDTGPATCSHSVQVSTQASTAISKSKTQTFTVEGGGSISIEAGVDFIVESKVTGTLSFSVSNAWASETGTTITTGKTNGETQTLVQQVGTNGFLSFTPVYQCWQGDASCGKDANGNEILVQDVAFCQPAMNGDKLSGQYNMVYIS